MKFEANEVYLPSMNLLGGEITQEAIDSVIEKIKNDVEFQKQFIVDQDVVLNKPLPHKSFQRTTNEKKCMSCTFRKICEEMKNFE
jgi:hypothetical protein